MSVTHTDQHLAAITPTLRVRNEVSVSIFDDKVREMGTITVDRGKITISLSDLPSMIDSESTGEFLMDSIRLGLQECWRAKPEAFSPY